MVIYIFLKIFSKYKRLIYFFSAYFQNLFKIQMVAYIFLKIFFQNIKDLYIFLKSIQNTNGYLHFFPTYKRFIYFFLKSIQNIKDLYIFLKSIQNTNGYLYFITYLINPSLCILIFTNSLLIPCTTH